MGSGIPLRPSPPPVPLSLLSRAGCQDEGRYNAVTRRVIARGAQPGAEEAGRSSRRLEFRNCAPTLDIANIAIFDVLRSRDTLVLNLLSVLFRHGRQYAVLKRESIMIIKSERASELKIIALTYSVMQLYHG